MGPKREPPAPQRSPRQASISVDPVFGRLEAGNLLLVNGPRPLLELPELPIEGERDSYADDDDGETHPGTYVRPRRGLPGRRPCEADAVVLSIVLHADDPPA